MPQIKNQKGFSLIELLIVVVIIGIIAAIAIPNLLASRRAANEGSALSSVRVIVSGQVTYQATTGAGVFASSLSVLSGANIIDKTLGCASTTCTKSGYNFLVNADPGVAGVYQPNWNVLAEPVTPTGVTQTGTRALYSNEIGVIYYKAGGSAPIAGLTQYIRAPTDGTALNN